MALPKQPFGSIREKNLSSWRATFQVPLLLTFLGYCVHPYLSQVGLLIGLFLYKRITYKPQYKEVKVSSDENGNLQLYEEKKGGKEGEDYVIWKYLIRKENMDLNKLEAEEDTWTDIGTVSGNFSSSKDMFEGAIMSFKFLWSAVLFIIFFEQDKAVSLLTGNSYWVGKVLMYANIIFGILGAWVDGADGNDLRWAYFGNKDKYGFTPFGPHEFLTLMHGILYTLLGTFILNSSTTIYVFSLIYGLSLFYFNFDKGAPFLFGTKNRDFMQPMEWLGYTFLLPLLFYYSTLPFEYKFLD